MKFFLYSIGGAAFFFAPLLAFAAVSIVPSAPSTVNTSFDIHFDDSFVLYTPSGVECTRDNAAPGFVDSFGSGVAGACASSETGAWHLLEATANSDYYAFCGGGTGGYAACKGSSAFLGQDVCVDIGNTGDCSPPPTPTGGGGGFIMMSASSSVAAPGVLGLLASDSIDSVILWTALAISLPLAFYIILELIEWFAEPRGARARRK